MEEEDGNNSDSSVDSGSSSGPNFNYILNMPLWCLTKEKVEELLKQRDQKVFLNGFFPTSFGLTLHHFHINDRHECALASRGES